MFQKFSYFFKITNSLSNSIQILNLRDNDLLFLVMLTAYKAKQLKNSSLNSLNCFSKINYKYSIFIFSSFRSNFGYSFNNWTITQTVKNYFVLLIEARLLVYWFEEYLKIPEIDVFNNSCSHSLISRMKVNLIFNRLEHMGVLQLWIDTLIKWIFIFFLISMILLLFVFEYRVILIIVIS